MNELVLKGLLKTVKNFLPPETVKDAANALIKTAIDFKNQIILNDDLEERKATGIIYEEEGIIFLAIAVFDKDTKVTRFEHVQELNQVIDNLIKKL